MRELYKSETAPRYDAREVAKVRADMSRAAVVLGSATPSVESYYLAEQGEYKLLTLTKRGKGEQPSGGGPYCGSERRTRRGKPLDLQPEIKRADRGPAGEQAAGDAVHEPAGICGLLCPAAPAERL